MKALHKNKAQVDPRLKTALRAAGEKGTVEAVLMFHVGAATRSAKQEEVSLKKLVASVPKSDLLDFNIFPNLRSVAVRARARAIRQMLRHPELAVATVNRR